MADDPVELSYEKGTASEDQLRSAIEQFFDELEGDQEIRAEARDKGVDLEALRSAGPEGITVSSGGSRFTGVETILIGIAVHAAGKAFDEVVLPFIKRRLSRDALGPKQENPG
jgi:hypothetical protein